MKIGTGVVLAVLGAAMTLPARADDASKRAKVEELFTVLKVNRMSEQISASVRHQMDLSMRSLPAADQINAEQKRLISDYETRVMALVDQTVSWKVVEPQMVDIYAKAYTEPELDSILAFYKSPVGQTMLAKGPELSQESMQITQGKLATLQPQISALAQDFGKKFEAAAKAPAPATSPAPAAAPPAGPAASKPGPK